MKPGFLVAVAAIMLGLLFVDRFLASIERRELIAEASSLYKHGDELLTKGRALESIGPLQRSVVLARENRSYRLALANALVAVGRLEEARSNLDDLLNSDSNAGPANLAMARLQVQLGNAREAEAYYHRAIYGTWTTGLDTSDVRLELAEFLAKQGQDRQLLSELLLLQDRSKNNQSVQLKIASLFLKAGSPARAVQTYRSLLRRYPDDADAYAGLAEAELVSGEYGIAQNNLRRALRRRPNESRLTERLELASNLSALDPTPRRLTSQEKYRRSVSVLRLATTAAANCAMTANAQPALEPLLAKAAQQDKVRRPVTNELSESLLDTAMALWQTKVQSCGSADSPSSDPLPILMHQIGNDGRAQDTADGQTTTIPDANARSK